MLSQPLPLPRRRTALGAAALVSLLAFLLGGALVAWLVHSGRLPYALPEAAQPARTAARPLVPAAATPPAAAAAPVPVLGAVETRLALLEERLSRIDGEADAASGNAARAEALLIAFATRRRIEQGQPLGYLEQQLKLRFAGAQPKAVDTLVAAARLPVTLGELNGQLEAAAPRLAGAIRDESTWMRLRRELGSLFVVRSSAAPSASPQDRIARARLMLASGKIDEAVAEVERLPAADAAHAWIEAARRYEETQRALELIEVAAMLEPRTLHDAAGRPVEQSSPLVPPAPAASAAVG